MATAIIKPETQEQFTTNNKALKAWADDLVVRNASDAMQAKQTQRTIRDEIKQREFVLKPFVVTAKTALDAAREELGKWINPLEDIDQALAVKVKEYERKEREAAARETEAHNAARRALAESEAKLKREAAEILAREEQKRKQKEIEEARKAGDLNKRESEKMKKEAEWAAQQAKEQAAKQELLDRQVEDVIVKPNIPTVAGVPSRVNWRFRVVDRNLVPKQYWIINEQMIGAEVRSNKDKTNIAGIEVFSE